jgi:hypothetical protein
MAAIADRPAGSAGSASSGSRLLGLYPEAWRERYGAEFRDLLEARPPTLRDRLDIVVGAIDARVNPQVGATPPMDRVVTAADRVLALAAVTAGALFGTWATAIAVAAPRWGSPIAVPDAVVDAAYGALWLATIFFIGVLFGLAHRYASVFTGVGLAGALVAAVGYAIGLAGAAPLGIVMAAGGTLALTPSIARGLASWPLAITFALATLAVPGAMYGFAASGGQATWLFVFLLPLGPAWMLMGRNLLRGGPPPAPAPAIA